MLRVPNDDARALARRLRELRTAQFGRTVPQSRLGAALGCSVPLISAWESMRGSAVPNEERLRAYAAFFSTPRSLSGNGGSRLLPAAELTPAEAAERDRLERELLALRAVAPAPAPRVFDPWRFRAGEPIRIVCPPVPGEKLQRMPHVDPRDPDHVALYRYGGLDALLELYGYLRAVNPDSPIEVRLASDMSAGDYVEHIVLLGGVDANGATRYMIDQLHRSRRMPVRQESFADRADAGFVVGAERFRPVVVAAADAPRRGRLVEDVAHFYRGPNPLAVNRTVTICNAMYGRGVLGAALALTRRGFRERNAGYLRSRFAGSSVVSVLSRVRVVRGQVLPPDWTSAADRLHEWAPAGLKPLRPIRG
jgi:transcriptional regulator with XRE-family HTH domain